MSLFTTATYSRMLTTKPLDRVFSLEHPEWVYILPVADVAAADMQATNFYTDGSTNSKFITLGELKKWAAAKVNIGNPVQDYESMIPAGKTLSRIEIRVNYADDKLILRPFKPSEKSDQVKMFVYRTSYNGYDSIICLGDQQEGFSPESQLAESPVLSGYVVTENPQYSVVNVEGVRTGNQYSGYKPTKEIRALRDMQLWNDVYEYINLDGQEVLIPVILEGGIEYPSAKNNLKGVQFSYRYAWDDRALDRIV